VPTGERQATKSDSACTTMQSGRASATMHALPEGSQGECGAATERSPVGRPIAFELCSTASSSDFCAAAVRSRWSYSPPATSAQCGALRACRPSSYSRSRSCCTQYCESSLIESALKSIFSTCWFTTGRTATRMHRLQSHTLATRLVEARAMGMETLHGCGAKYHN
jgi:hypothetical protein